MASSKLIGTAPDQVPTNADLGELAFQNKDSVEFTGGKGGLSSLDLTAIAASKNVSATDIFVYDTSKDSDGGQWRYRCQNTSWYNETLNTDTRGSRREFPSVAVIVAVLNVVTIYDGDSPDLPMWMVVSANTCNWANNGGSYAYVAAVNGIVAIGCSGSGYVALNFAKDERSIYYTSQFSFKQPSIAARADGSYTSGSSNANLGASTTNDVAMTVLPNAPIDATTGLPIPTIAVATNGGVSVIHNTGNVVNITCNNSNYTASKKVTFLADNALGLSLEAGSAYAEDSFYVFNQVPQQSTGITVDSKSGSPISADAFYSVQQGFADVNLNGPTNADRTISKADRLNFGTPYGLSILSENRATPSSGMVAFIGSKYNTGFMPGKIKGAWLCDTVQETLTTINKLPSTNFTNWTAGGGWSISGGTATHVNGSSGYISISVGDMIRSRPYTLKITGTFTLAGQLLLANHGLGGSNIVVPVTVGTGTFYVTWTQGNSTGTVNLYTGSSCSITEVQLFDGVADYSVNQVNANGLQVYGSITKTPVATGADLVAYSGFSTGNYLQQPYSGLYNFGTGDFSISGWYNTSDLSATRMLLGLDDGAGAQKKLILYFNGAAQLIFHINGFSGGISASASNMPVNAWTQFVCVRVGGVMKVYINGSQSSATSPNTDNLTFASNSTAFSVGYIPLEGMAAFNGSVALVRISATAPSDDQIKKMYNDEKVLFQDNAKATLYGTSDAVTALAYDQDTKLLHVGTSSGRSVFQGLRRVDNTTTAVSTSISAANGLVAEN